MRRLLPFPVVGGWPVGFPYLGATRAPVLEESLSKASHRGLVCRRIEHGGTRPAGGLLSRPRVRLHATLGADLRLELVDRERAGGGPGGLGLLARCHLRTRPVGVGENSAGGGDGVGAVHHAAPCRSEEHTSELQSLMRITYA